MPLIDDEEETETTPGADIPIGDGDENEEEEVAENMNLPPVALVVEDGTGLSDANSYADLDFALEYCVSRGYSDWLELSDDEQKIHLIRGTEFVDNFYEWKGQRSSAHQAMAFPRRNVVDGGRILCAGNSRAAQESLYRGGVPLLFRHCHYAVLAERQQRRDKTEED